MFDDAQLLLGRCYVSGRRGCGPVEPFIARAVHDPGLLVRRCMRSRDFAVDRPDEGRQLAGDRSYHDRRPLALARQCPEAATEPHLRLPGNLAGCSWRGPDPGLHVLADAWREPVAPRGLDEQPACTGVAGLGDAAALDALSGRSL